MKCANCEREIVDGTPSYSYVQNWIHIHSQHRECDRPNVAIPKREGDTE